MAEAREDEGKRVAFGAEGIDTNEPSKEELERGMRDYDHTDSPQPDIVNRESGFEDRDTLSSRKHNSMETTDEEWRTDSGSKQEDGYFKGEHWDSGSTDRISSVYKDGEGNEFQDPDAGNRGQGAEKGTGNK